LRNAIAHGKVKYKDLSFELAEKIAYDHALAIEHELAPKIRKMMKFLENRKNFINSIIPKQSSYANSE